MAQRNYSHVHTTFRCIAYICLRTRRKNERENSERAASEQVRAYCGQSREIIVPAVCSVRILYLYPIHVSGYKLVYSKIYFDRLWQVCGARDTIRNAVVDADNDINFVCMSH